jgi:hypothetical protein
MCGLHQCTQSRVDWHATDWLKRQDMCWCLPWVETAQTSPQTSLTAPDGPLPVKSGTCFRGTNPEFLKSDCNAVSPKCTIGGVGSQLCGGFIREAEVH